MTATQKIQSEFALENFIIKELSVKTKEVVSGTTGKVQYDVDYELKYDESNTQRVGSVDLFVDIAATCETESIFSVKLHCLGKYSSKIDLVEKVKFMELLEYNGIALILPLVRSYLLAATSQWGIGPPLMFPTINVVKLVEKHRKEVAGN
jgi:preprotein translocase subunit SecB